MRNNPLLRKSKTTQQYGEDVSCQLFDWKTTQQEFHPDRVMSIDETRAKTNMTRPAVVQRVLHVLSKEFHLAVGKTTTFLGALRSTGFVASLTVDRPINGRVFPTCDLQHLVATLADGNVVIRDNLFSHKVPRVREAIESAGTEVCYLPLYSPDLNPIELAYRGSRNAGETVANGQSISCGIYEAQHSTGSMIRKAETISNTVATARGQPNPH